MRRALIIFVLGVSAAWSWAAEPAQLAHWAEQLGDPKPATRAKAWDILLKAGPSAEPVLRETVRGRDGAAAIQAAKLLSRLDWRLPPDASPEMLERFDRIQSQPYVDTEEIQRFVEIGPSAMTVIFRLVEKIREQEDADLSAQNQFVHVVPITYGALPPLLARRDWASAERLFEEALQSRHVTNQTPSLVQDYCALALSTGRLGPLRRRWSAAPFAELPIAPAVRSQLALLDGDQVEARKLVEGSEQELDQLWRMDDWPAILERMEEFEPDNPFDALMIAALQRRIGSSAGLSSGQHRRIKGYLGTEARPSEQAFTFAAQSVLGRHSEMMRDWKANAHKRLFGVTLDRSIGIDWLPMQFGYTAAMGNRWNGGLRKDSPDEAISNEARWRAELGDFELAKTFHMVQGGQGEPHHLDSVVRPAQELAQIGLVETAREITFARIARFERSPHTVGNGAWGSVLRWHTLSNMFESCFHHQGDAAEVWLNVLMDARPLTELREQTDLLIALLDPTRPSPPNLRELTERLCGEHDERFTLPRRHHAAAAVWYKFGDRGQAARHLRWAALASRAFDDWSRYIHFLATHGLASQLGDADRLVSDLPYMPNVLFGMAFVERQAGRPAIADGLAVRAGDIVIGDVDQQLAAMEFALRIGDYQLVRRLGGLSFKTIHPSNTARIARFLEAEALIRGDYRAALEWAERDFLLRLRLHDEPSTPESLFLMAHLHALRARVALEDGRVDAVMAEARQSIDLVPSQSSIIRMLHGELIRRGYVREAEEIYSRIVAAHRTALQEWPDSPMVKSGLARVMAAARRDLDEAIELAKSAARSVPYEAIYVECVAEVHLQRGEWTEAKSAMRRAERLEPTEFYMKLQRQRIERARPDMPLPSQAMMSVLAP